VVIVGIVVETRSACDNQFYDTFILPSGLGSGLGLGSGSGLGLGSDPRGLLLQEQLRAPPARVEAGGACTYCWPRACSKPPQTEC
jgi:hypothetical protein